MDSDSDSEIDITQALIPSSTKSKSKATSSKSTAKSGSNGGGVFGVPVELSDDDFGGDQDAEDELFASLPSLARARNLAEGTQVVKQRRDLKHNKHLTGGGSFQALGLPAALLKALLQRGFTQPTPIQRLALPSILGSSETVIAGKKMIVARDHLCMARTGSGKTLCYLLPLLAQLMTHSTAFGARGLILVPTRELALQVLKVGKDLARGLKGEGEALRWAMIVGGEGMEEQFSMMAGNPDVIIATPGRLLHLIVEMNLDLRAIQYCVFDEADRLFELGFAEQLHEILHRMPPTRQTLLFSATLPSTLVGFAKAGLQNPKLIRLDVDSKISKDLQMAYLSVKGSEKEALLLSVLREVISVPLMTDSQRAAKRQEDLDDEEMYGGDETGARPPPRRFNNAKGKGKGPNGNKKRKRTHDDELEAMDSAVDPTAHQTLVFVATKHHVEYISAMLVQVGYSVSPIYGSMDQTARKMSLARFRAGHTSILVVTDLAARGIDVPGVENVINYDFPNGTRAFVHRVGRTARAGRKGWAYTFVTPSDLPHLLDLELFLSRPVKTCPLAVEAKDPESTEDGQTPIDFANQLVLGTGPRSLVDLDLETVRMVMEQHEHIDGMGQVARRGQRMYERGLQKASAESYRRAKELERKAVGLASTSSGELKGVHPIFDPYLAVARAEGLTVARPGLSGAGAAEAEAKRAELMAKINGFKPTETVFEVGMRGKGFGSQLMKERRKAMVKSHMARRLDDDEEQDEDRVRMHSDDEDAGQAAEDDDDLGLLSEDDEKVKRAAKRPAVKQDDADDEELEAVFGAPRKKRRQTGTGASYRDPNFYMGYEQEGADTERGYSLTNGDSFVAQAAQSQYDIAGRGDTEGTPAEAMQQRASTLKWDRRQKKFVRGDQVGADNKKLIKSESGQKLSASFKSGVFDEWKRKQRVSVPKVGEPEAPGSKAYSSGGAGGPGGGSRPGGDRKFRHKAGVPNALKDGEKRKGRTVGKPGRLGAVPGGLKNAAEIRKERIAKEKRVRRSTQPGKKGKGAGAGGGGGKHGGKGGRK